jgi:two-component system heavy metal sensor histidine kinase CusS
MLRLSLSSRLIATFVAIATACFGLVGILLFQAASQRIYAQDETNLVLSARHLRRLAAELDSVPDLLAHKDRLVVGVLGDANNAMRIMDESGHPLVEHDPAGYPVAPRDAVPSDRRILSSDIRSWRDAANKEVRGISTVVALRDGTRVTAVVARSMADREALLSRYLRDMLLRLLLGLLAAVVLSYLLVRQALRPLRTMANEAAAITVHQLSSRLTENTAPAELRDLAATLNSMLARLEEGFSRVWQFTVDLAHDLRTPLGNLRGANEVALTRPRSQDEYQALLGSNIEECERVSRTIENVLFLARAESPQFAMQRTTFDLGEEMGRLVDYFEGVAAEAGVAIDVDADTSLYADRDLFRRVMSNLLSNALRYTPAGHAISIQSHRDANGVTVVVQNPGPGIPPEHIEKLFDRFYRVDRSRSDSALSTGLGLSIVKSIMELHSGQVTAESSPLRGTLFTLRFPQ